MVPSGSPLSVSPRSGPSDKPRSPSPDWSPEHSSDSEPHSPSERSKRLKLCAFRVVVDDMFFELATLPETVGYYMDILTVREKVLRMEIYSRVDQEMGGFTILTKQGVDVCNGDYFSKWLEEPNPLDPGKTNHESAVDSRYGQGPMRDLKRKQFGNYRVAMGRRFGWHALNFFWTVGFVDQTTLEAFNLTTTWRREAKVAAKAAASASGGAASSGGFDPAAAKAPPRVAYRARREARRLTNKEKRYNAAHHPEGECERCGQWAWTRRTQCLRCGDLVCENCQGKDEAAHSSGGYAPAAEVTWYLLCGVCLHRYGNQLDVEGAVGWEPLSSWTKCANGDDHPKDILQMCVDCNRWLCRWCCRDDGPPHKCRQCPELMRRRGESGA